MGKKKVDTLKAKEIVSTGLEELSGMAYDGKYLYSHNDASRGKIYKLSLEGKQLDRYNVKDGDLEGICFVDGKFYCVREESYELVEIDLKDGKIKDTWKFKDYGGENTGVEALAYDSKRKRWIVGVQVPQLLLYLDEDMKVDKEVKVKIKSVSDVAYDEDLDCLWLISASSKELLALSHDGEEMKRWKLDEAKCCEGITVVGDKLYVCTDRPDSTVMIFDRPKF